MLSQPLLSDECPPNCSTGSLALAGGALRGNDIRPNVKLSRSSIYRERFESIVRLPIRILTVVVEYGDLLDGSLAQYDRTRLSLAQYCRHVGFIVGDVECRLGFIVHVQTQLDEEHLTPQRNRTYQISPRPTPPALAASC